MTLIFLINKHLDTFCTIYNLQYLSCWSFFLLFRFTGGKPESINTKFCTAVSHCDWSINISWPLIGQNLNSIFILKLFLFILNRKHPLQDFQILPVFQYLKRLIRLRFVARFSWHVFSQIDIFELSSRLLLSHLRHEVTQNCYPQPPSFSEE